ncbi:ATP-binding cassette domain-containing protein [Pseudonocardia sp. WMMC193]|uniref:ATP-binding cassette domain-containing protein n=1 Tax=Pseudonocardia sp. WMMC193 TaxID=2911965 RepID=UPI001F02893C|nr:ATP-binding cassette domain-containing protein [Pseudonocardia sp. WMMC193]MCF7553661.1 ATP-binding cassette domain-containing protein [Pseudonocardia sp. WMMC193]
MIEVTGLSARAGETVLLEPLDLTLAAGETLVVLGDSGAGKSTLGAALAGAANLGVQLSGVITLRESPTPDARVPRSGRTRPTPGPAVVYLPQDPADALDPVRRIGAVLRELAGRRSGVEQACAAARLNPSLLRRFPHQLSGGQQQRAALAQLLVVEPAVLVLDEPTSGLDPTTAAELVDRLTDLCARGTALVLLTHDHAAARRLGGAAIELSRGRVVRRGPVAELAAEPAAGPDRARPPAGPPRLSARGLRVADRAGRTVLRGIDLDVSVGEVVAVVGRSGAGKTTLGRALAGLVSATGTVTVDGTVLPARRRRAHRRAVQYVHQDTRATFRAHRPVVEQVARPAVLLRGLAPAAARAEAEAVLGGLGLAPDLVARRPGTLSGGQLQRAAVARALLARPAVLVADEVTSALDARHRGLVLAALRAAGDTAVVVISHDLPAVDAVADRVVVVADGLLSPSPGRRPSGTR